MSAPSLRERSGLGKHDVASDRGGDAGTALPLALGMVVLCLAAAAGVIDAAAVVVQRLQLEAAADSAALAGAQALDVPTYYARGASAATALAPALVRERARRLLVERGLPEGARVDAIDSDATDVRVRLSAPVALPFPLPGFVGSVSGGPVARITVESRAQLALRSTA